MKIAFPSWLKKEIKIPVRPRRAPTAFQRKARKVFRVLIVLLAAYFVVWRAHLHWKVTQRLAAIRASGFPASPTELDEWYRELPESDNAATVLAQAFTLARNFSDRRSNEVVQPKLLDRREAWSAETRKDVTEYVLMNAESLLKAVEAVRRPQCRYPVDLSYGLEAELPHLPALKALARIIALRAILAAEDGRYQTWADDIHLILRLAATLDQEPTMISQLVRASIVSIAAQTTERALTLSKSVNIPDDKLIEAFVRSMNTNSIRVGLVGERAMAVPAFRLSWSELQQRGKSDDGEIQNIKPVPLAGRPNPVLWLTGLLERDLNFFLTAMETNIALANVPPPAGLAATNVVDECIELADRKRYFLSGMFLPSLSRVIVKDAAVLARTRLVETALAIERFRAIRDRLPDELGELTPQFFTTVLADPFDGKPLRYHQLERGYVVYSVDRDGRDDGGREKPARVKSSDKTAYDITFVVER